MSVATHRLLPRELVSSWASMSDDEFRREVGDTPLLVIRVADDADLLHGLETAPTMLGRPIVAHRDKIGFRTVAKESASNLISQSIERRRTFERHLAELPHFLAPLRRRDGVDRAFAERILVGRAFSNDVVLRHPSVSKLHAWFERDADGTYCLRDSGSRNGTQVGGQLLEKREVLPVKDGDVVVFGDVSAFFCRPPRVREILRGRTAASGVAG